MPGNSPCWERREKVPFSSRGRGGDGTSWQDSAGLRRLPARGAPLLAAGTGEAAGDKAVTSLRKAGRGGGGGGEKQPAVPGFRRGAAAVAALRVGSGDRPVQLRREKTPSSHGPGSFPALRGKTEPEGAWRTSPSNTNTGEAPRVRLGTGRGQPGGGLPGGSAAASQLVGRFHPLDKGGLLFFFFSFFPPSPSFGPASCGGGPFAGRRGGKVVWFAQVARGGLCATVD